MGLKPELGPQISYDLARYAGQSLKELSSKFRAAIPAFPTEKLRHHSGRDPVGRKLSFSRSQPSAKVFHCTTAHREMTFKAITVNIDQPWQNHIASKIDLATTRFTNDAIRKRKRFTRKPIGTKHFTPDQS
jgi:hypothetical protein